MCGQAAALSKNSPPSVRSSGCDPPPETLADLHRRRADDIGFQAYRVESPMTWAGLAAWIDGLKARYGANLLRDKGVLNAVAQRQAL
ncbi:hypothetical protein [Phenylobacterium immobile]|uniref:hypothetical protein n=1 Tax=Phenylobacterium immobile TaxID=21 RepID=UPI000B88FD92|nr:hypothetical protein [Phenylobacterium immobile]